MYINLINTQIPVKMRDFCSTADKDCIRLIVAQDLKESGIDVDSNLSSIQNATANNGNTSYITSNKHSNSHHTHNSHHHGHVNSNAASTNMTASSKMLNTSGLHNSTNGNHFFHNTSNNFNLFQSVSKNCSSITSTSASSNANNMNSNANANTNSTNNTNSEVSMDNQLNASAKVFGVNLKQIEMVNLIVNEQTLTVPCFLKYAIEYINEFIHVEGIFRRNGTASRLKELKKQVEEGIYNFSQFAIFDLTSLIKLFFRELPESLLTFSLYSNFIQAVKLETTKSKLESILNLCLQLPDINLHVLIYLMHFLKQITQQESLNKMNSFNLAVCFAPNIIYTRINKVNDLYINEERIVVQLLIENSTLIGKISDSVYERSMMLNSLCCSTTIMINSNNSSNNNTTNNPNTTSSLSECSKIDGKQLDSNHHHNHHNHSHYHHNHTHHYNSSTANATSNAGNGCGGNGIGGCNSNISNGMVCSSNSSNSASAIKCSTSTSNIINPTLTSNNDLMFLYDNDLQENSSFALHHAQSAGSTSLSSYCGSSSTSSKKEKKKRRSSSLKELMITIQNSISKFRRRSASEKNDKTTCSIITCTSMTTAGGASGIGANSSSFISDGEKQKLLSGLDTGSNYSTNTPYIGHVNASSILGNCKTPICASLYATPRINKRNAEDSLQSTTKKKLMEKLPQRNLLLPNAPITPFSTSKKSSKHHPFKQLLSTSEATSNNPNSNIKQPISQSQLSNNMVVSGLLPNNAPIKGETSNKPPLATNGSSNNNNSNQLMTTPQQIHKQQIQTPSTLKNSSVIVVNGAQAVLTQTPAMGLHKQLRYEDSPANIFSNQTCELGSFKPKYQHLSIDKNLSLASADMLVSSSLQAGKATSSLSSCPKHHHHHHGSHHHHHHHSNNSSGAGGTRHHDREHRHNHHSSSHASNSSGGHHSSNHHHHNHHSHHHSGGSSSGGHHGHSSHSHHKHSSSTKSSSSSSSSRHHQHHHHQYVNAMPTPHSNNSHSSSSSGNSSCTSSSRHNKNTDLCTKIISGSNFNDLVKVSSKPSSHHSTSHNQHQRLLIKNNPSSIDHNHHEINFNNECLSLTSASSSSGSNNVSIEKQSLLTASSSQQHHLNTNFHNHTSACCGLTGHYTRSSSGQNSNNTHNKLQESSLMGADNSMRCTLRRGRPNTPKSGLSMEYRIRKSSVPNTPECKHHHSSSKKINYTISNDDIHIKSSDFASNTNNKKIIDIGPVQPLNMAIIDNEEKVNPNMNMNTQPNPDDLNDARWFEHDLDIDENIDLDENINDRQIIDIDDEEHEEDENEEDEDEEEEDEEYNSSVSSQLSTTKSAPSQSPSRMLQISNQNSSIGNRQLSLSLSNLPQTVAGVVGVEVDNDDGSGNVEKKGVNEAAEECKNENKANYLDEENKENAYSEVKQHSSKSNPKDTTLTNSNIKTPPANKTILEQQLNQITFEPFEFKLPENLIVQHVNNTKDNPNRPKTDFEYMLEQEQMLLASSSNNNINTSNTNDDSLLQNVLRRQSLFKLKEKINGKVSKQINEIEKRKLSPYRFSNSPLKNRKTKDCSKSSLMSGCSGGSSGSGKSKHVSPIRVPSIFCKKILAETPQESYIVKTSKSSMRQNTMEKLSKTIASTSSAGICGSGSKEPKLPSDTNSSPLLVRAANQFYKKLNRNRSIKRLNVTMSSSVSQTPALASISETDYVAAPLTLSALKSVDLNKLEGSSMTMNSPMSKQLLNINEWKCSSESIDL